MEAHPCEEASASGLMARAEQGLTCTWSSMLEARTSVKGRRLSCQNPRAMYDRYCRMYTITSPASKVVQMYVHLSNVQTGRQSHWGQGASPKLAPNLATSLSLPSPKLGAVIMTTAASNVSLSAHVCLAAFLTPAVGLHASSRHCR